MNRTGILLSVLVLSGCCSSGVLDSSETAKLPKDAVVGRSIDSKGRASGEVRLTIPVRCGDVDLKNAETIWFYVDTKGLHYHRDMSAPSSGYSDFVSVLGRRSEVRGTNHVGDDFYTSFDSAHPDAGEVVRFDRGADPELFAIAAGCLSNHLFTATIHTQEANLPGIECRCWCGVGEPPVE